MFEFKLRTPDHGSFIFFNNQSIDHSILDYLPMNAKALKPTLEAIFASEKYADNEQAVSISLIAKDLGLSPATMNNRIRALRKLDLLLETPFCFVNENGDKIAKRRAVCLTINNSAESVARTQTKFPATKQNMSELAKKKHRVNRLYNELNLHERPNVSERLPNTFRHTDLFVIEQLAISGNEQRQKLAKAFYVTSSEGKSHQVVAQIQSFSRILDSNDLQVLFACYTLIYLYHSKSIEQHIANGTTPKNFTPIHVDDILRVQQKSFGGESRKSVRDSLMAIKDTEYDLYGLVNINIGTESSKKYADRRYRNFIQCSAISDFAPEIQNDGSSVTFAENSMIYLVELPEHVFESLLYNKTLFVFPSSSLSVPSVIFMIYLRLRSLCRTKYDDTLQNLNAKVSPTQRFGDFKRTLVASMKRLNRFNDPHLYAKYDSENQNVTFNLWGYHGKLSLKENYVTVTAHQKEIIEACNLDSTEQSSPTMRNSLHFDFLPYLQVEKALPRNLQRMIQVNKTKYALEYPMPKNESVVRDIQLTAYSSTYDVNLAIDLLSASYNIEKLLVSEKVTRDLDGLSRLQLGDYEVTPEDFSMLKLIANTPHLTGSAFISAFIRRKVLSEELLSVLTQDAEPSDHLLRHVRSYCIDG